MISKSTYKELEQRIKVLEKELSDYKSNNSFARPDQQYLEAILNNTNLPIYLKDSDYNYILINHQYEKLAHVTNDQIQGKNDFAIFPEPVAQLFRSQDEEVVQYRTLVEFEETIPLPDGVHTFLTAKFPLINSKGEVYAVGGVCTDITASKLTEAKLKEAYDELEQRVADRTAQLDRKTENLTETNIALKILLVKREEDKKELEKNVIFNIEKLISPYVKKLRKRCSEASQKALLEIIQSNLDEITSSFAHNHKDFLANLTPTQIQVANMIKQGQTTKEIALLLNLSPSTIACHRQEIRKRLALTNKKINLQAVLLANS